MKKERNKLNFIKLLSFMMVISFINVNSQSVTITEENQIPQIGQVLTYQPAVPSGFNPEGEGPVNDKTWDFENLASVGSEMTFEFHDPDETDYAGQFPNADVARANSQEEGYFFYETSDGNWDRWGFAMPSENMEGFYNDPAREFMFPMSWGETNTSFYDGDMSPFGVGEDDVTIDNGQIIIAADQQGTLITPMGVFEDVLRVRLTEEFIINVWIHGVAMISQEIEDDAYYWFHEDYTQPILMYYKTYVDGDEEAEVLRYQVVDVDIEEGIELTSGEDTDEQEVCMSAPITDITYNANGLTGAVITGLPDGVTGEYSSTATGINITISGIPEETGMFNYNIETSGGEENPSVEGSIEVLEILEITSCPDDPIVITEEGETVDLADYVDPDGGTFSGDGVSGSVFDPDGLDNGEYIIEYILTHGDTGCDNICEITVVVSIDVEESIELTSDEETDDQEVCVYSPIVDIVYTTTGANGADFSGLPDGVNGVFSGTELEGTITISGEPENDGVFNYEVTLTGGTEGLTASGTIEVNELPELDCPEEDVVINENEPVDLNDLVSPEGGEFSGEGVTDNIFDPEGLEDGEYVITYVYVDPETECENYCEFTILLQIETNHAGEINDDTDNVIIYPNPSNGIVYLENAENYQNIKVFDLSGNTIISKQINQNSIDLNSLVPGLYIIKLTGENSNPSRNTIIIE